MAVSSDGGESFINFKVSESPFTPTIYDFLGHYIAVSAHNNAVRPVWTRIDNGYPSLWTARVDSITSVDENQEHTIASDFVLYQNYPNPFNPSAKISWQSPVGSWQTIKVFDVLGIQVATLVDEYKPAGKYEVEFNATSLPSGVYFYQLKAGDYINTKKMLLLK